MMILLNADSLDVPALNPSAAYVCLLCFYIYSRSIQIEKLSVGRLVGRPHAYIQKDATNQTQTESSNLPYFLL